MSIYQDLVEQHGFAHRYNSVKRFVAQLKAREPERFDVLEYLPGEEAPGGLRRRARPRCTSPAEYRRPYLFVMTLKYSGKSFRKVVWKTRSGDLGPTARAGVAPLRGLLSLRRSGQPEGRRDHAPTSTTRSSTRVYAAMLAHYGVVADPCRVGDPNRNA